jgi:hypothetical protein
MVEQGGFTAAVGTDYLSPASDTVKMFSQFGN